MRDTITNVQIRKDVGQEPVTNIIERKGLRGFWHVIRMSEDSKPKQILEARAEEKGMSIDIE